MKLGSEVDKEEWVLLLDILAEIALIELLKLHKNKNGYKEKLYKNTK